MRATIGSVRTSSRFASPTAATSRSRSAIARSICSCFALMNPAIARSSRTTAFPRACARATHSKNGCMPGLDAPSAGLPKRTSNTPNTSRASGTSRKCPARGAYASSFFFFSAAIMRLTCSLLRLGYRNAIWFGSDAFPSSRSRRTRPATSAQTSSGCPGRARDDGGSLVLAVCNDLLVLDSVSALLSRSLPPVDLLDELRVEGHDRALRSVVRAEVDRPRGETELLLATFLELDQVLHGGPAEPVERL